MLYHIASRLEKHSQAYSTSSVPKSPVQRQVPGVELRFGLRKGLDESLQDRILTKARKHLSRQNSTKLCLNLWENVHHQKCVNNIRRNKIRQIDAYIYKKIANTKCINVRRNKIQQNIAWENACLDDNKPSHWYFVS